MDDFDDSRYITSIGVAASLFTNAEPKVVVDKIF
jgi:hypothetical protein